MKETSPYKCSLTTVSGWTKASENDKDQLLILRSILQSEAVDVEGDGLDLGQPGHLDCRATSHKH